MRCRLRAAGPPTLALAALFGLAGCRPDELPGDSLPTPAELDACALLPYEEAVHELGGLDVAPARGVLDSPTGAEFARCSYAIGLRPEVVLFLEVRRQPSAPRARAQLERSRRMLTKLSEDDLEDVAGMGDAALWAGGKLTQLHVAWRDLRLIVGVSAGSNAQRRTAAEHVARRALARLEGVPVPEDLRFEPKPVELDAAPVEAPADDAPPPPAP
jgi:hypothetical protein